MIIPQGITFGNILAKQHAKYGILSSMYPELVYSVFGTSDFISYGLMAVACLIIGDTVEKMSPIDMVPADNLTYITEIETEEIYRVFF